MVALTDINVSYLSDSTAAALLVEGLILLGVGLAADRLRRRVGEVGPGSSDEDAAAGGVPAPVPEPSFAAPEGT